MATSISFSDFDLEKAKNGALVGMSSGTYQLDKTGYLMPSDRKDISGALWMTTFKDGTKVYVNNSGAIVSGGSGSLQMANVTLDYTSGTKQIRTRTLGNEVNLSALQPRDHFALSILQALIQKIEHPENANDATILKVCSSAYQWAQGMMICSADFREEKAHAVAQARRAGVDGDEPEPEPDPNEIKEYELVEIDLSELENNTDRLLYNIFACLDSFKSVNKIFKDRGLKVKGSDVDDAIALKIQGSDDEEANSIKTKIDMGEDALDVNIKEMPEVEISGTPDVNVTNMLSEPVSITGTVTVEGGDDSGGGE